MTVWEATARRPMKRGLRLEEIQNIGFDLDSPVGDLSAKDINCWAYRTIF